MKITKILPIFAVVTVVVAAILTSCGSKYDIDDIRDITKDLVERSAEMNKIYFGEGLPTIEKESADEFYDSFEFDIKTTNYLPVSEDCSYQTEAELKEATLEIFTENYCEFLFERAFAGISQTIDYQGNSSLGNSSINEDVSIVYAMYIEKDGVLTVRLDLDEEAMKLGRVYDYVNLKIVREANNYVIVEIPTELDGRTLDVELKIVKTEIGWRLDSPTY